jgi:hypothetical protein
MKKPSIGTIAVKRIKIIIKQSFDPIERVVEIGGISGLKDVPHSMQSVAASSFSRPQYPQDFMRVKER